MLKNYIKMAFAVMKRRKLVTSINLLGIGFTLAFLTIIYALYDLQYGPVYPLKNTSKMVSYNGFLAKIKHERGVSDFPLANTYKTYKQLQTELESVEDFAIQRNRNDEFGFFHNGKYMALSTTSVSSGFWNILNFKISEGKLFTRDDVESKKKVAVISNYTASILFPEDNAIGNTIKIKKVSYKVIGIVENVGMKSNVFADVWIPFIPNDNARGIITFYLKDEYSTNDLSKELTNWYNKNKEGIVAQLRMPPAYNIIHPKEEINLTSYNKNGYIGTFLSLLNQDVPIAKLGKNETFIFNILLILTVVLFLSIPVINMVNLNTSQIADRASEIGIRKSFGATTKQLVRQFLVENIILTLVGGILSIGISLLLMALLKDILLNSNPLRDVVGAFQLNWRILTVSFLSAIVFGIISGVLPAYRMSKLNAVNAIKGNIK